MMWNLIHLCSIYDGNNVDTKKSVRFAKIWYIWIFFILILLWTTRMVFLSVLILISLIIAWDKKLFKLTALIVWFSIKFENILFNSIWTHIVDIRYLMLFSYHIHHLNHIILLSSSQYFQLKANLANLSWINFVEMNKLVKNLKPNST